MLGSQGIKVDILGARASWKKPVVTSVGSGTSGGTGREAGEARPVRPASETIGLLWRLVMENRRTVLLGMFFLAGQVISYLPFKDGRVVEDGEPEELLKRAGHFAHLYELLLQEEPGRPA